MPKILSMLVLSATLLTSAHAQFFTSCSRQKSTQDYSKQVERSLVRAQSNEETSWVKLIKAEEDQVNHNYSGEHAYGRKVSTFTPTPANGNDARTFTKRLNTIQQAVNHHGVLRGYALIVPRPVDLTQLYEWEINHLAMFFLQGTTYREMHLSYLPTNVQKLQDAVVEIRFQPQASSHTAILLIDCRNHKIYLFIDKYPKQSKNK